MKRKGYLAGIALCVCLLAGCGGPRPEEKPAEPQKDGGQSGNDSSKDKNDPGRNSGQNGSGEEKPTPAGSPELVQLRTQYPKYEPGTYVFSDDPAQARRNLNLVGNGYLCEAEEGLVYYIDRADGMVYQSRTDGSERVLVSETGLRGLQETGGVLYGADAANTLYRYLPESGLEPVMEQKVGDFIVSEESVFYCGADGIYRYNFADKGTEKLADTGKYTPVWMTMGPELIIYTLSSWEDPAFLQNGLVYCLSRKDGTVSLVAEKCYRATLLGNRLIFQSYETNGLVWMDMETGERTDVFWSTGPDGEEYEILAATDKGVFVGEDLYFTVERRLERLEPAEKTETGKTETVKMESEKTKTGKTETGKMESGKTETGKAESKETETGKAESEKDGHKEQGLAEAPWSIDYIFQTEDRIFLCNHQKGYYFYELSSGSSGIWGN